MGRSLTVEKKLEVEVLRRGANGAIPQILLLLLMSILIPDFRQAVAYRVVCFLLIFILAGRFFVFNKFKNDPEELAATNPLNLYLGIFTSVGWAFVNGLALFNFHVNSLVGIMHVFITNGLLAGVMYSLSPVPKLQKVYVLILGVTVSLIILFFETRENFHLAGVTLLIFVVYLVFASRSHAHDLRSALEFEERLLIENVKLQEVIDSIPGFMILVNPSGEWVQYSKSSAGVFDSKKLKEIILDYIRSGFKTKTLEVELEENRSFVVSFEKLGQGSALSIIIGLPIDELKRVRRKLETQKAIFEYHSRLSAVGEMAGGVAHEINNPLAVISLSSEMLHNRLEKSGIDPDLWKKNTDRIFEMSQRITKIIKSLQNLTREDVLGSSESINIHEVIHEVIDVSGEKMKRKGIKLQYIDRGNVWVKGNHLEIGQVLLNLINNSFDAIDGEGLIQLEVLEDADKVRIKVSDTGSGIPKSIEGKIFYPFFSSKQIGEGTGLGLSISQALLEKSEGTLELVQSSHPTIFQLTLKKA